MRWTERLPPDGTPATFGAAWELFRCALGCLVLGHSGTQYPPEWDGDDTWRDCRRCGREWVLEGTGGEFDSERG